MIRFRPAASLAVTLLTALMSALVLGGCTGGDRSPAAPAESSPSSASTASPYELRSSDLPAGWRDSSMREHDFRLTVCGVDLEPRPPQAERAIRFARSAIGPFLEQYVRTYDGDRVTPVIEGLQRALPTCRSYTADAGAGRTVTFRVEPLRLAGLGAGDVAWRQTSVGDRPITADYVLTRRGTSAVVLASYAVSGPPPADVLPRAVRALQARP